MIRALIMLAAAFLSCVQTDDPHRMRRDTMIAHDIEGRGIMGKSVIDAMRSVPRHEFVPKGWIDEAYDDRPLPIGYGQTISQPYIVAYMTELVEPQSHHTVLEIGTGSGYQAAILSKIVKSVYTVEIITELAASARLRLQKLGYKNVTVRNADGYDGWPERAPFDAIIVTAAAEFIPPPLIEQLKDGGRMVIPIGSPFLVQTLMLVQKNGSRITTKAVAPVRFVPFTRG
jgi:protein-L-isoaspartate(D-aspartate) O-methyltransferase